MHCRVLVVPRAACQGGRSLLGRFWASRSSGSSWLSNALPSLLSFLPSLFFPQIAGSYRGSNFSKGGIVLANWPTSGCCSECCAGCCQGCCCGCCPGCSGSCLPLGGVRVLSRVLCRGAVQGAPDHVCHWVVSGCCPGSPDHVCHWAVSGCCPGLSRVLSGCSGSCLPLGGVNMLSRVLCRGAVQGAPDHVCHWAVSGCCAQSKT